MFGHRKPKDETAAHAKMAWDLEERAAILRRDALRPGADIPQLDSSIAFLETMAALYRG